MPSAIVMSFGDELTSGQRVDTNSAWLSANLAAIGQPVTMHLTAGDDLESAVAAIRFAGQQADVVVMTGGLGPTADDLTRAAMAEATGLPLELDEAALARVEEIFSSRGREMPQKNRVQAMFPKGSIVIPNPHGTAPGIDLTTSAMGSDTRFIALPGVPAEAKEMWAATVEPRLLENDRSAQLIRSYLLKCFGEGESALEQRLEDLMRRDVEPLIGITVHQATITLRITVKGATEEQCDAVAEQTIAEIRGRLGDLVFGSGADNLQDAVIRALHGRQATLATLECDGQGLLVRWLKGAAMRYSNDIYLGGIVCSDSAALNELVDLEATATVDPNSLDPASAEFCALAAASVREQCGVTHALVVGAIPQLENETAKVNVAIATADGTKLFVSPYGGHPDVRGPRLLKSALDHLRKDLLAASS